MNTPKRTKKPVSLVLVRRGQDIPYTPNFADKRVKARIETVLTWVDLNLSQQPRQIRKTDIEQAFGPIGNKLGDYLRQLLLVRSGHYSIENKRAYQYSMKPGGIDTLLAAIEKAGADAAYYVNTTSPQARVDQIKQKYVGELTSLDFKYNLKSDRYWHPLQNLNRTLKPLLWNSTLPFNYDIEACAPTLLKQTAERYGLLTILSGPIADYLNDRGGYRQRVSEITGLDLRQSKQLINSFFNGARLAKNSHCAAYQKLLSVQSASQASKAMDLLQEDKDIRILRLAIRLAWTRIANHTKTDLSTSKQKWGLYFSLERQVLDAMKDELYRQGAKVFTEHDGFRSDKEVDLPSVINAVKVRTGFDVKLVKNEEYSQIAM